MPINQDQFWGSNAKVCVTYPINANLAILLVIFNKKYVVLIAIRRFGWYIRNFINEKIEIKSVRFVSNKTLQKIQKKILMQFL